MTTTTMLAPRLKRLRERRGLSIRQLALRAQTSPGTIQKIEAGTRSQVSFDVVARIALALDVSLDYLAGHTNVERPPVVA
jgi:XRE family transcriptional regulator, master regulator for biofilm formation